MSCQRAGAMGKWQLPLARHGGATPPHLWMLAAFSPSATKHLFEGNFDFQSEKTGCQESQPSDKILRVAQSRVHQGPLQHPQLYWAKGNQERNGPCCCILLCSDTDNEIKECLLVPASLTSLLTVALSWQALGGGHSQRWGGSIGSDNEWGHWPGWAGLQKGWQGCPLPSSSIPVSPHCLQWPGLILWEKLLRALLDAYWPLLQPPYPTNRSP